MGRTFKSFGLLAPTRCGAYRCTVSEPGEDTEKKREHEERSDTLNLIKKPHHAHKEAEKNHSIPECHPGAVLRVDFTVEGFLDERTYESVMNETKQNNLARVRRVSRRR